MNTSIIIFLICCMWPMSEAADNTAYCFQFTWPGPITPEKAANINCTSKTYKGIPCITPILTTSNFKPPNTTELWNKRNEVSEGQSYFQELHDGYTCIRYSYIFDNAVLNVSYYCGRITDGTVPITSGCFYYEVNSKIIEVCACRSQPGSPPCNKATKQTSSAVMLFFNVIIFNYFYNK